MPPVQLDRRALPEQLELPALLVLRVQPVLQDLPVQLGLPVQREQQSLFLQPL